MIDTDGHLACQDVEGSQSFVICQELNTHGHIIDGAEHIAKSLGFKTVISFDTHKPNVMKVLSINGNIHRIPTKLPRKQATKTTCRAYIGSRIKIQIAEIGPYVGWYLDGNERFLLGDFTVVHNTRAGGGEDAANPRYTCISLPWWTHVVFRPEDKRLEKLIEDEGDEQECENLFPILPMHLINGVVGIATAYSTNIPNHNPLDIAFWLQQRNLQDLQPENNHQLPIINPYYKGFKGQILPTPNGFITEGIMTINYDQSVTITELPIGSWTDNYEKKLAGWEEAGIISSFDTFCTDEDIKFVIHKYLDGVPTLKSLKLISKHSYNNMTVLYRTADRGIQPRIYNNVPELIEDWYKLRLAKYVERKALMLIEFDRDIHNLSEKARYIHAVAVDQVLEVRNRPEREILVDMDRMGFTHDLLDKVKTRALNKDQIPLLYKKIQAKRDEKAYLETISPNVTFYNELEEFVVKYCKEEKCARSTMDSCNPVMTLTIGETTPKSTKKKVVK